jgi:ATP-dependent Clp protease ATP-binding subunit ClpA
MNAIIRPSLGFAAGEAEKVAAQALAGQKTDKLSRAGKEAARKRFSPEFMNRIDKTVVFNALGDAQLRQILGLEIQAVEERVCHATGTSSITFSIDPKAQDFLLREGTDLRYGARHLKRAVERHLVQPTSNLLATSQLQAGDTLVVDFDADSNGLAFSKECREIVPRRQNSSGKSAAA